MIWPWKRKREEPPSPPVAACGAPVARLATDVGCVRELNEDSGRVVEAGAGKHGERGLLVVVADGMGGHQAGEVASQTAVETIASVYPQAKGTPAEALEEAFRQAHQAIFRLAKSDNAMLGMGTTCTALAIVGGAAIAVHVGDSRLYLWRAGSLYQLSEDHTQCMEMVRRGLLTLEEARRHEDRNVLVRAMGTRQELTPMTWPEPMPVRPGDRFVLCSDGLHDRVPDDDIAAVVAVTTPEEACSKLVEMARQRGGYDNITVAVVAIPPSESVPLILKETRQAPVTPAEVTG